MTLVILVALVGSMTQALKVFSERSASVPALRDGKALALVIGAGQLLAFIWWQFGWDVGSLPSALGTGLGASAGASLLYKVVACTLGEDADGEGDL